MSGEPTVLGMIAERLSSLEEKVDTLINQNSKWYGISVGIGLVCAIVFEIILSFIQAKGG